MPRLSLCARPFYVIIFIMFLLSFTSSGYSQYMSPLSSEGGVDTHIYKTDTALFESIVMEDAGDSLGERNFTTGISMLHSPNLSTLYIPLKYDLNDYFRISLSLPYLTRTLVFNDIEYTKSGYGDTLLGLTGFFEISDDFSSSTTARFTFPTGNVNAVDFYYYIPMGYGGYTASLQESLSLNIFDSGVIGIRLFLSGVGIYYFSSTHQIDMVEKNTFDNTYAWSVMGGSEIELTDNLSLQVKANYISVAERRYKTTSIPGQWIDANDSVKQVNILPFIKYQFRDDISGQFGLVYPVKTIQDSDIAETHDAKWKIAMGIEKKFGDSTPSEKSSNDNGSLSNSDRTETTYNEKPKVTRKRYYKKKRRKK